MQASSAGKHGRNEGAVGEGVRTPFLGECEDFFGYQPSTLMSWAAQKLLLLFATFDVVCCYYKLKTCLI